MKNKILLGLLFGFIALTANDSEAMKKGPKPKTPYFFQAAKAGLLEIVSDICDELNVSDELAGEAFRLAAKNGHLNIVQ